MLPGQDMQTLSTRNRCARPAYTALLIAAIITQLILSYFFNIEVSHYVADDLGAIELAHQVRFWDYIQVPVDIHRVPLHRATNYLLHNLLPMNFAAATTFMLACHALTLLVLYRLLQRLNAQALNGWLVAAYALNAIVPVPLHWWSAGLHRFPFVLAAVISCYGFVRFVQCNRIAFAALAMIAALCASGFYIKGILVPLYWLALLFCVMDFHDWRKYWRPLATIVIAGSFSLAYAVWYAHNNTYTVNDSENAAVAVRLGMEVGMSTTAQMPFQLPYQMKFAFWFNLAWIAVLFAFIVKVRDAWRAVIACLLLVAINMLMICLSSRSSQMGALIMFSPRYYFDVLFLLVIFSSIMCRNLPAILLIGLGSPTTSASVLWRQQAIWALAVILVGAYALAGWKAILIQINPGPEEGHWLAARYERNLMNAVSNASDINLVDAPLPGFFVYEAINHRPLMLKAYLAWHGLHPQFGQANKPLNYVDEQGNLHPSTQQ